MLNRLGIVAWWLGVIIILLAAGLWTLGQYQHRSCSATLELNQKVQAAEDAARSRYMKEHPSGNKDMDELNAYADVRPDPRDTDDFRQAVSDCEGAADSYLVLIASGLATLVLWSFAFVLGGSFWRPPKANSRAS